MLVIGAGLAGSLVALALAERGAAVELVDPGQGCS
ncbi:NAD(P)-binding protein, partial [Synechococcus sp. BA-124 BA4]